MDLLYDLLPPFSTHTTATEHIEDDVRVQSKGFPHSLVLANDNSTARDHCANERTFLSWVRLSMTLSVVSLAIIISFHLRLQPTLLEQRMAMPLGIIFWILAMLALGGGVANYTKTTRGYAAREPVVETGSKTTCLFAFIALAIVVSCILFIVTGAATSSSGSETTSNSSAKSLASTIANNMGYLAQQM